MNKPTIIKVPRENVNDEFCTLIDLKIQSGDYVEKGSLICIFETSKATFEVEASSDGYAHYLIKENDEVEVGKPFCMISKDPKLAPQYLKILKGDDQSNLRIDTVSVMISKSAQSMIKKYSIDAKQIKNDGIIKKSDVELFLTKNNSKDNKKKISNRLKISDNLKNILIVGAGGHAKMIIDIINSYDEYNLVGLVDASSFIDKDIDKINEVMGIPVLSDESKLKDFLNKGINYAVNAVGFIESSKPRQNVYSLLKNLKYEIPNIVHKSAVIESSAKLGAGNHVFSNSVIGSSSVIANNCIINSSSVITHDVIVGNNVHITPGALIGGYVEIGSNTVIGMGSTVHFGVKIGSNVRIHSGCSIHGDISDGSIVKK